MKQLALEIVRGRRLSRKDDLSSLIKADLKELMEGADQIRSALCGDRGELCSIINGRSGRCCEDCKFCAQSAHYHTSVEEYPFRQEEEILELCRYNERAGVDRFSIVTAGHDLTGPELEKALSAYRRLKRESGMELCASMGFQTEEEFQALKCAGVSRYHANLETSRRYFPIICTTHTYQDKLDNIARARRAGLEICSGGIIGMGETWADRIDMALDLAELEVCSIPLNILRPIPGTPLENAPPLTDEDILRTVAVFRYINPTAWVRMAAGRGRFADGGAALFRAGANAAITGDMLTTTGTGIAEDRALFQRLGYRL